MKEKKEKVEKIKEPKKRMKGTKGRIAGKIIAALMVVFMLVSVCSTAIYYIINQ